MSTFRLRGIWLLAAAAITVAASPAHAQFMSARRMAMGGVTLIHGGAGGDEANVAARAVPPDPRQHVHSISLPIGIIPVLQDLPTFNTKDSTFNAFKIANLGLHLPWNIALTKPREPMGDVTLSVAKNSLTIDLGDLRDVVPSDRVRFTTAQRGPSFVLGFKRLFAGVSPYVNVRNDFELNDALRHALHDGAPFLPQTQYAFRDRGAAQVAAQAMAGAAVALVRSNEQDSRDGVYVGARGRLLRGLAYADVDETVGFTTADTLFGTAPLDANLSGLMRTAQPADGGTGHGFDAGVVFIARGVEVGIAANDLATSIDWKVKEVATRKDTASGGYQTVTLAQGKAFTSTVPATYLLTAETRIGEVDVAVDAARDGFDQVSGHVGAELWMGRLALRAGAWTDARQDVQVSGGVGVRMSRIGFDVAVATTQSNLTRERTVDLGAGLSWYPRRKS